MLRQWAYCLVSSHKLSSTQVEAGLMYGEKQQYKWVQGQCSPSPHRWSCSQADFKYRDEKLPKITFSSKQILWHSVNKNALQKSRRNLCKTYSYVSGCYSKVWDKKAAQQKDKLGLETSKMFRQVKRRRLPSQNKILHRAVDTQGQRVTQWPSFLRWVLYSRHEYLSAVTFREFNWLM